MYIAKSKLQMWSNNYNLKNITCKLFHKYGGRTTCRLVIWLVQKIELMVMSRVIFQTTFGDMLRMSISVDFARCKTFHSVAKHTVSPRGPVGCREFCDCFLNFCVCKWVWMCLYEMYARTHVPPCEALYMLDTWPRDSFRPKTHYNNPSGIEIVSKSLDTIFS